MPDRTCCAWDVDSYFHCESLTELVPVYLSVPVTYIVKFGRGSVGVSRGTFKRMLQLLLRHFAFLLCCVTHKYAACSQFRHVLGKQTCANVQEFSMELTADDHEVLSLLQVLNGTPVHIAKLIICLISSTIPCSSSVKRSELA